MRGKETSPVYAKGQDVQVNVGSLISPEWMSGGVTDLTPETEDRLLKLFEKVLRLEPMIVEIDEDTPAWAGAKIKAYRSGSRVRPKSVRQK